jgi:hypothetical protein
MANGVTIPDVSVQSIPARMSGLRSLILSFFESTEAQPEYKNNRAWNEPINQDAKGLFRLYYQNVHGIPRHDVNLSQDLQALAEYMSVVFVCRKLTLTGTNPTSSLNIYQDKERRGNTLQHHFP